MGISVWQILILLLVVILLFGTSKLRNVGTDLGSALKGFKKAVKEDETDASKQDADFESLEKPTQAMDDNTSVDSKQPEKQANKE